MNSLTSSFIRLLRWSERYTKTDMVYLAKGGSWLLLANGTVTLLSLLVLYAFANFIPQQVYGEYRFVLSVFEVFYITTLSGLGTALSQAVASGFDGNLKQIVRTRLAYGLAGALAMMGVGIYYLSNANVSLGYVFLFLALAVPLFPTSQLYMSYLLGKKNFKLQSLYSICARVVTALVMIPALYFSSSLFVIVAMFFLSNIGISVFLSWRALKQEPPNGRIKEGSIAYGKHVSVVDTFSILAANVDKMVMWKFLGPISLASFLIAYAIPQELITRIVGIFTVLAFPKFGENAAIRPVDVFQKLVRISAFMIVPVALYILAVPLIFSTFFPQYVAMAFYAQILSLILVFAPFMIITTYFSAQQMTRKLYLSAIGDLVMKIVLFAPLVYVYGMKGAVYATVGFFFLRSAFYIYLLFVKVPVSTLPETINGAA